MQRRTVRIKENSWLAKIAARKLRYGHVAMVFGRTIHLHNVTASRFMARQSWVLHELKHVEQYDRYGMIGFLWRYAIESARRGYFRNKYEVEARAAEGETALLDRYTIAGFTT